MVLLVAEFGWLERCLSDGEDSEFVKSDDWRRRSSELRGPAKSWTPRVSERGTRHDAGVLPDLLFHLAHFAETNRLVAHVTDDTVPSFYFEIKTTPSATLFIDSEHFLLGIPERAGLVALVGFLSEGGDEGRVGRCAELLGGRYRLWWRRWRRLVTGGSLVFCTHPFWTKVHRCSGHFAGLQRQLTGCRITKISRGRAISKTTGKLALNYNHPIHHKLDLGQAHSAPSIRHRYTGSAASPSVNIHSLGLDTDSPCSLRAVGIMYPTRNATPKIMQIAEI